jgi:hypothetical protein
MGVAVGCAPAGSVASRASSVPAPPLVVAPLADLVPAGGLRWAIELRPRALFASPGLVAPVAELLPEAELDRMTRTLGGADPRSTEEVVVAGYGTSTLSLARLFVQPPALEAAFAEHVGAVAGRAVTRRGDDPGGWVTRVWGGLATKHEALLVLGREAAGFAVGDEAPLRAAELLAERRLKRSTTLWHAEPFDRLGQLLGDAPARAVIAGPFEGEWARGLGGLLAASTGAGVAARVEGDVLRVTAVVAGSWPGREAEAEQRARGFYEALSTSGLGRLLGLTTPATPPTFAASADTVTLDVRLRPGPLFRGFADATTTSFEAMLHRPNDAAP